MKEFEKLQIEIVLPGDKGYLAALQVASPQVDGIKKRQSEDFELIKIKKGVEEGELKTFTSRMLFFGLKRDYECQML